MQKVLVIGGAGFIGSFIARALVERKIDVTIFDSFYQYLPKLVPDENKILAQENRFKDIEGKIKVIRGNAANYGEVRRAIEEQDPDCIIHLAGLPLANKSNIYIEESLEGVKATGCILQVIKDTGKKIKFIYTSSSTVYGDFVYQPADEDHPKNPRGVYAGVKLAGEHITSSFCRQFNISYVIIRPSGVYGPTDINERVVQKFIENAIEGKEIVVKDPTNMIDFTYVKDLAEGYALAVIKEEANNETFNITCGQGRTLGELAEIIKKHFPKTKLKIDEADKDLPRRGGLSIERAKKKLGYVPKYPLEKGIEEYIVYYKRNVRK
ncbi:3-beta hydroxysteroid dehydrogenase/isomerase family protein [archaeon GW2011_AR15]|nr:3-beta hydroxysteroid dehydrogenase/isomerase family protein [archaeon GW2011_AR15]MBS3103587.1 NAD(P)-dependent oxidoreductase [Candidatus Woesearchaeota archaeon]